MTHEELHRRYGGHVSQRLQRDLSPDEFSALTLEHLFDWLETRAEHAHDTYRHLLSNPLAASEEDQALTGQACRKWREAEDLAYLVALAVDSGAPRKPN